MSRQISAEERARAELEGWQSEERFRAHRDARHRRATEFARYRAEGHGPQAAMELALQAGRAAGVHRRRSPSLPSGPASDMRSVALGLVVLVPSAIGLGIALGGYAGISVAVHLWRRIRRA